MSSLTISARRPVLADLVPGALARDAALVAGGAVLTGLAAQVVLPMPGTPVPFTGQTFAALLVGAALGWRRGAISMALYLAVGALGVPWFNNGTSGVTASFGYVAGFILAGALVGALAARGGDRTPLRTVGTMVLGNLVIYVFGVSWLMASASLDLSAGLAKGVVPFLLGDVVKIVLAAAVLPGAWALVGKRKDRD